MSELASVCSMCQAHYAGPVPGPGVEISHGFCPGCQRIQMAAARGELPTVTEVRLRHRSEALLMRTLEPTWYDIARLLVELDATTAKVWLLESKVQRLTQEGKP